MSVDLDLRKCPGAGERQESRLVPGFGSHFYHLVAFLLWPYLILVCSLVFKKKKKKDEEEDLTRWSF